jgi:hypothetical protein
VAVIEVREDPYVCPVCGPRYECMCRGSYTDDPERTDPDCPDGLFCAIRRSADSPPFPIGLGGLHADGCPIA